MFSVEEYNRLYGNTAAPVDPLGRTGLEQAPEDSPSVLEEVARGVGYGAVESVRSIYNLGDTLFGDGIDDWENPIDRPMTWYGNLIGGVTQFAVPYAGFGKIARVGSAVLATKGSKIAQGASKFAGYFGGSMSSSIGKAAVNAAARGQTAKSLALATLEGVSRGAVRGALVDLVGFEGHEQNLSNIVQTVPQLEGILPTFLAIDEDDSELEGRLKNVLEGAALGAIFDTVLTSVRAVRAGRAAKAAGATDEEAAVAAARAADDSIDARRAAEAEAEDIELRAKDEEPVAVPSADAEASEETMSFKEAREAIEKDVKSLTDHEALFGLADDVARGNFERSNLPNQTGNPRNLSEFEARAAGIKKSFENLRRFEHLPEYHSIIRRTLEEISPPDLGPGRDLARYWGNIVGRVKKMGRFEEDELEAAIVNLAQSKEEVARAATTANVYDVVSVQLADSVRGDVENLMTKADLSYQETVRLGAKLQNLLGLENGVRGVFSQIARELRTRGFTFDPKKVQGLDTEFRFTPLQAITEAGEAAFDPKKARELLDNISKLLGSEDALDNMKAVNTFLETPLVGRVGKMAQEYHINALLSGVSTHVVNLTSGLFMSFWRPIEKTFGAGIYYAEGAITGNVAKRQAAHRVITEEMHMVGALVSEFTESFRAVKQSGGNPFQIGTKREGAEFSAIQTAAAYSEHPTLFSPIAKAVTLPSTFLEKSDNWMKTWNGRARARVTIQRELARGGTDPAKIAVKTDELLAKLMESRGALRDRAAMVKGIREANIPGVTEDLLGRQGAELADLSSDELDIMIQAQQDGLLSGKEATFTSDLTTDTGAERIALHMQSMTSSVPALKFFLPFIRTPFNIARYGWDRSIGSVLGASLEGTRKVSSKLGIGMEATEGLMLKFNRQLAHADEAVRADARGRLAMGIGMIGAVYAAIGQRDSGDAELPFITGSGPSNPDALRVLKQSGWQPFSIRVNGKYYSYSRLDPAATLLGITVDASEYLAENLDEDGDEVFQTVSSAALVSLAQNLTSKTYAQGLSNLLDMLMDPDRSVERVLGGTAASFVPTIAANTANVVDPTMREIRSVVDRVQSRVPGLSAGLPPRRDLLGKPIKRENAALEWFAPVRVTKVADSVVAKELGRFAYGFSEPQTTKQGIDLLDDQFKRGAQTAYDRYLQLAGEVKIGGLDLRQALRKEIKSERYQRLDPGEGPLGEKSPRIDRINLLLRRYRAKAWRDLQRERPQIRSSVREVEEQRSRRRRGLLSL